MESTKIGHARNFYEFREEWQSCLLIHCSWIGMHYNRRLAIRSARCVTVIKSVPY